jgi:hypothetical protein
MGSGNGFGSWLHLSRRFFGALLPFGPSSTHEAWALDHLITGEQALWHRMSGPDRRHAVGVAQDTIRLLGSEEVPREVTAAALLHDVGKVESSFGTIARALVTFAGIAVGRAGLLTWADRHGGKERPSARARVGLYLSHDRVGAELLQAAGSHPLTVSWAAEHHLAAERWTIDPKLSAVLKAADGD